MLYPQRDRLLSTWILPDYRIIQMSRATEQVAKAADYSFHPDHPLKAVFPITSASSGPYTIHHSTGTHTLLTQVKLQALRNVSHDTVNSTKFETSHSLCTNNNGCCKVLMRVQKQHCQLHRGTHFLNTLFQISCTAPI
jgi:hypothetical protein